MIIKGNGAKQLFKIMTTFLIISVTLFYTSITAFASNYVGTNDTVYKSADYWGLEELPYGVDTGVVQFQYDKDKFLTLYFDKLSIYDEYQTNIENDMWSFIYDHYWNARWSVSGSTWDYKINIISDSPIYYKKAYAENGVFSSQIGTLDTMPVYFYEEGSSVVSFIDYPVYILDGYSLSSLAGDWTINTSTTYRRIYSNCYQIQTKAINGYDYYVPFGGGGVTPTPTDGRQVGYNLKYYPTCEYLQNASIRETLLQQYEELINIESTTSDIYGELVTANVYLQNIRSYLYEANAKLLNIYNQETQEFKKIDKNLIDIKGLLNEILTGQEYDSSSGIGSNTEFGDTAGGLMQDTVVPDVGTDSIVTNLGNSFLFIRNMFDRVTGEFNLTYVISFLLGLSFIAYVLGRVIKNKMNS